MAARKLGVEAKKTFMLIGHCVPSVKSNAVKIKVKKLELDTYINMYFRNDVYYHALDHEKSCQPGDVVLIKELSQKMTKLVTHEVIEVVHKFGDVTDPITGKKVVVGTYRDAVEKDNELYGKVDSAFDYKKAPPRGWQEGKKDFTNKDTYRKYHVFPEDDPYAVYH